jgi:hypothetical protein
MDQTDWAGSEPAVRDVSFSPGIVSYLGCSVLARLRLRGQWLDADDGAAVLVP